MPIVEWHQGEISRQAREVKERETAGRLNLKIRQLEVGVVSAIGTRAGGVSRAWYAEVKNPSTEVERGLANDMQGDVICLK